MRPEILFSLFKPVTSLNGVGPRIGTLIETVAGANIVDLCWHLPGGIIDRRYSPKIVDAETGTIATMVITVIKHHKPPNRRMPYKITCSDETGTISLVFFHAHSDYLLKNLPEGQVRAISGKVERFGNELQMTHPDHIVTLDELDSLKRIEPVYPLTAGLGQKPLGKAITSALELAPELGEWIDPNLIEREHWPSWHDALLHAHHPKSDGDMEATSPARLRLAYDELLANQVALALMRRNMKTVKGRSLQGDGHLRTKIEHALPFQLTASQVTSLGEITEDMAAPSRMLRLLQGDVGSGKTVVALQAMMNAIETGAQAALMAPTEILARQHFATIKALAAAVGVETVLLTGREKGKKRDAILATLSEGSAKIAIGTHALFQGDVEFQDLAIAVIDEQHRFGVHQRLTLAGKGRGVDILVMTATPIPRTLMLTAYGDMDVSRLTEKPAGRKPVETRTIPFERLDEVIGAIGRSLQKGSRVYWVCPLVEESQKIDLAAAEDRYEQLRHIYGERVGLIHGRMKAKDKDAVMQAFVEGTVDLLVATTVIEVGVDVPEATVMVIEHSERFGLAQLHQLRGRIGRSDRASTCLLVYSGPLTQIAHDRLTIMRETEDGFRIAEEDLRLRGAGELLGTRQSGLPEARLADLAVHGDLLAIARDDATVFLNRDPDLLTPRGQEIRTLLYLFNRDTAVLNLRSG
jgi:ATP-dependent DNA helicase RecG